MKKSKHPATVVARAGGFVDVGSGGVVPPVQSSTTFVRDDDYNPRVPNNVYGRDDSDQVRLAENIICDLEKADDTLLFSSGMAAIGAVFSFLKRGDVLVLQSNIYWGTTALARRFCAHREITLVEADSADTEAFLEKILAHRPSLVMVETPSNPWMLTSDIAAISKACREVGAIFAVDATASSPVLLRPLELDADLSIHSATKVLNGHSDVIAGVVSCKDDQSEIWHFLKTERHDAGAILSPHSAWLLIRGLRTLDLRVERMCSNASAVAQFLNDHEKIDEVWYPGISTHAGHELAAKQMQGRFGYLLSFLIKGGRKEALNFCRHLQGIHLATSLGGVESLVEHRHSIEGNLTDCPPNLIRLSVGIEDISDLIAEIDDALQQI